MRHIVASAAALLLLGPVAALADPIALTGEDAPGLRPAKATPAQLRGEILGVMRGGQRTAVRRAPAKASAFAIPNGKLLTGSIALRSDRVAASVQRSARSRTRVTRKSSVAIVVVRAGRHVGLVSLRVRGRNAQIGKTAAAYAAALKARLTYQNGLTVAFRLGDKGNSTTAEALALFKLAYGSMPGARIPAGERGVVEDGTVAAARVLRLLPSLTPAQRGAFENAMSGGDTALTAAVPFARMAAPKLTPDPKFQAIANEILPLYEAAARFGRPLGFPIKVFKAAGSINATADAYPVDAAGKLAQTNPGYCRIRLGPPQYKAGQPATYQRFVVAHEIFHCFEFSITTNWGGKLRDWVIEGMADWGATQVVSDPSDFSKGTFAGYLMTPGQPLFNRAYTAVGFWGHVHERAGNFWPRVVPTLQAADNVATFDVAGGSNPAALTTIASRRLRESAAGAAWDTSQPFAIPTAEAPTPRSPTSAATAPFTAKAFAERLVDVLPTSKLPVVEITRDQGNVRFTDGGADYPDAAQTFFCLGAACECQAEEVSSLPSPLPSVSRLVIAIAGEKTGGRAVVHRHSLKEYCKKDKKPPKSGGHSGPGGTNGDPHLTSLDGLRYDFQAAGEFVLVRSASGDLEVQARQEPWKHDKTATINTQLGFRIGGKRVTVSSGEPMVLRIGGVARSVTGTTTVTPVGAGRIEASDADIEVVWPDGSTAIVFPVGSYGVAMSLTLADARANHVKGLLGDFDNNPLNDLTARNGVQVKFTAAVSMWPGLNRVRPANVNTRSFFDALYDKFGESWRIRQSDSLLDYGKGQTTATFTNRAIPTREIDSADFSSARRARAEAICRAAGVTAPGALEDCILDVMITGRSAFADAASREEGLMTVDWVRLAAGADRYGPVSLARTPDGTLHLVWEDRIGTASSVVHAGLPAAGGERAPVLVGPYDTTPYVFSAPDGLRVVGAVIDVPTSATGIFQFASPPPYTAWASRQPIGTSYVGEPMAVDIGGTLFTVSGLNGHGRIYRGDGSTNAGLSLNPPFDAACYAQKPAIATTGAETYVAWYQWGCPQTGLYVASVNTATGAPGPPVAVPQSSWTTTLGPQTDEAIGLDRLSLAARAGVGIYLAYSRQDGDRWSALLWRIGAPAPMTIASGLATRPDSLQVSAEPTTGNLWVAWETQRPGAGKGRLAVRRTNAAGTDWLGPARGVPFPHDADSRALPIHPWDILARDGALDIVAGYTRGEAPGALWRAVVPG